MHNRKTSLLILGIAVLAFTVGVALTSWIESTQAQAQSRSIADFPAVPGAKGGEDMTGPYDPDPNWPKPLSTIPGHDKWTWGAVEGIFAESPDRVYIAQRGELPALMRPANMPLPQIGPSLSFPTGEAPFRNASQGPVASLPGGGAPGDLPEDAAKNWKGRVGVDARWEDCIVVVNSKGEIVERWTQWDNFFKRPHAVYINPYDPDKNVWIVDDYKHALFKFTNDGKKLLQTIGTPDQAGADDKHFNRPTFITWLPNGTMFVSDGYNGTRVVKLDKTGKFVSAWGQKGTPPNETRPGYFNVVHGIAADPVTGHVYVVDRANHRIQVFDENGKFVDQWAVDPHSSINFLYLSADRHLWAADDRNSRIVEYDLQGHLMYSWGTLADWPGGLFNTHGMSVDQEGNFYVAEVGNGRAQKFIPRKGAAPALLVGKPVYSAWK